MATLENKETAVESYPRPSGINFAEEREEQKEPPTKLEPERQKRRSKSTAPKHQVPTNNSSYDNIDDNNFIMYKKRPGTVDSGKEYEYLMCAIYALRLMMNEEINDFEMTTNNEQFGDFDDVSLDITFKDETSQTFLIQLKHKENSKHCIKNRDLCSTTTKNNDFSLLKYLKTFKNLKKHDNVTCVLYTNAPTKIRNDATFQMSIESAENLVEVRVVDRGDVPLVNLISNTDKTQASTVFQFHINQNENSLEYINKFSNQFYFFSSQANLNKVKSNVDQLLKQYYQTDIFDSFVYFMKTWWAGKFVLTKHDVIAKLTELVFSPFIRILSATKQNSKTQHITRAIMSCELSVFENNKENIVENIWTEVEFKNEQIRKAIQKYALGITEISNKQKSVALWYMELVPLIVNVTQDNEHIIVNTLNILRKHLKNKRIVVVGSLRRKELPKFKIFQTLHDLNNIQDFKDHLEFVLENFCIRIQEKPSISLQKLTQRNPDMMTAFSADQLLEMTQNDFLTIGRREGSLPEYYVSRNVRRIFLNTEKTLHGHRSIGDCIIIINCSKSFEHYLQSNFTLTELSDYLRNNGTNGSDSTDDKNDGKIRSLLTTNKPCSLDDFDELCKKNKNCDVYVLQIIDSVRSVLLFREGNKLSLNDFSEHKSIEEHDVLKYFDASLNVVVAPPGMGKSALFTNLNHLCPSDVWSVRIDLINYNSFLKASPDNEKILFEFLKLNSNDHILKNALLKIKKVIIFLDGLDEIESKLVQVVLNFVKYVSSQGLRIWISSRENLRKMIVSSLKTTPIEVQELNEEQQKMYIKDRLKDIYDDLEIKKIANAMFTSSDVANSRQLLGVPLQLFILTETLTSNCANYENLKIDDIFVFTTMYRLFFDGKIKFHEDKIGSSLNQMGTPVDEYLSKYQLPALKSCLDSEDFFKLNVNDISRRQYIKYVAEHGDKCGIIQLITNESEAVFAHQTFAEYFACLWLKNNPDKLFILRDRLFSKRYENLKIIFDILLAEKNPLHLSVIYKNVQQVEKHIADIDAKDFGGRTALHLACTYGNKFSPDSDSFLPVRESQNFIAILKILLQHSFSLYETDDFLKFNCIDYACESLCVYPVELMLEKHLLKFEDLPETFQLKFNASFSFACHISRLGYNNLFSVLFKHHHRNFYSLLIMAIIGCENENYMLERSGNLAIASLIFKYEMAQHNNTDVSNIITIISDCEDLYMLQLLIECGLERREKNTVLHYISKWKYHIIEKFTEMVELYSATINRRNYLGQTALHIACQYSRVEKVRVLLDFGADVNAVDEGGNTVLYYATLNKQFKMFDYLISCSEIDVTAQTIQESTTLQWACQNSSVETIQTLIQRGCNPNEPDENGNTLMHFAAMNGDDKVLDYFMRIFDINVRNRSGETPLHFACRMNSIHIVKKLIDSGSDVNVIRDDDEFTIMHVAASRSNMKVLEYLIDRNVVNVNIQNRIGETVLHLACEKNSLQIVKKLIECGADVNVVDIFGNTIMHHAALNRDEIILDYLIDSCDIDVNSQNMWGETILHMSCRNYSVVMVKKIVESGGDVNLVDINGNMTLHFATLNYDNKEELLNYLLDLEGIDRGCDVNVIDSIGETVMNKAKVNPDHEVFQFVVDYCHVDSKFNEQSMLRSASKKASSEIVKNLVADKRALQTACKYSSVEIVDKMIKKGVDVEIIDGIGNTLIHYATFNNNFSVLSYLVERHNLNVNSQNNYGKTPLHYSCQNYDLETTKELVEHGGNVTAIDNEGNTIMHSAALSGNGEILNYLIDHGGVDVNTTNIKGQTALHLACQEQSTEIVKKLIEFGGNVKITDNEGNTLLHYAKLNKQFNTLNILYIVWLMFKKSIICELI